MNNFTLKNVFDECKNYNIMYNLDDSYVSTEPIEGLDLSTLQKTISKDPKYKNHIAYIYSKSDIKEIMESLEEEGSSIITYEFIIIPLIFTKEQTFYRLLSCIFNKYGYSFKIKDKPSNKKIKELELVITINDIPENFRKKWSENNYSYLEDLSDLVDDVPISTIKINDSDIDIEDSEDEKEDENENDSEDGDDDSEDENENDSEDDDNDSEDDDNDSEDDDGDSEDDDGEDDNEDGVDDSDNEGNNDDLGDENENEDGVDDSDNEGNNDDLGDENDTDNEDIVDGRDNEGDNDDDNGDENEDVIELDSDENEENTEMEDSEVEDLDVNSEI
jgi:hypothetical protein